MTTIAITGATGILGGGILEHLHADDRVDRLVGVARRDLQGTGKVTFRRADVRDRDALTAAFAGADAVAHLAFAKFGHASREDLHAVNVEGTLNAFAAAAAVGARRFVFASSAAAYGFDSGRAASVTEDEPAAGSRRWFYSREKAQLESLLREAADQHDGIQLTVLRPTIVVGPRTASTIGTLVPPVLRPVGRLGLRLLDGLPGPTPALTFPQPLQFVHEDDVSQAFARALIDGPGGTFNLAGDGVVDGRRLTRELGFLPLPAPAAATRAVARALVRLPRRPSALEAMEVMTAPVILDCALAKRDLGWRPRYGSLEALRAAIAQPARA
jgi:nucleoside-diphosphate-sugar epimerase